MATVTPPIQPFNRPEADRRVRHPLHAIRGCIRRYVMTEGAALAILFVAVCFWLGLAFDFLIWTLFSFDWLYSFNEVTGVAPTVGLRVIVLLLVVIGLGGLITLKIFRRLFKEFNDAAVAMLLERRFPRQLGDRLITAVELADPKLAQKYGYSQAMVDKTIRDAAERVEKLPVHQIFRWGKLRLLVALAILATVGLYALVGLGWCAVNQASPLTYLVRFHHTASIWGERNVLMMNSYWPPSTFIELIRFPGDKLSVPREESRPDVKVRYARWVIASSGDDAPRGWRALRFADLENLLPAEMLETGLPAQWDGWLVDLDDLDPRIAVGAIPPEWGWQGATIGDVRRELRTAKVKQLLDASTREAVFDMFNLRYWTVDKIDYQLQYTDPKAKAKTAALESLSLVAASSLSLAGLPEGGGAWLTASGLLAGRGHGNATFAASCAGLVGTPDGGPLLAAASAFPARTWLHPRQAHLNDMPVADAMRERHQAAYDKFQAILAALEELAARPTMGRTLRKLDEPTDVVAQRKGKNSSGTTNCTLIEGRKFLFQLDQLKESCEFRITTRDYSTPWRKIALVPPPMIDQFRIDKDEPAYLWYRRLSDSALLKDKRQKLSSNSVSTTGPYSKAIVPLGTDVTIIAHSDRPLTSIRMAKPEAKSLEEKSSISPQLPVDLSQDKQTFSCIFKDVRRVLEFDFEFKDEDGVRGSRRVIILPRDDQPPRINELGLAVVPRLLETTDYGTKATSSGPRWVITPDAFLKIRGKIEDDHGLAMLQYKHELVEVPFQRLFGEKNEDKTTEPESQDPKKPPSPLIGLPVVTVFQYAPGPSAYGFFAASYYGTFAQVALPPPLPPEPKPVIDFRPLERAKLLLERKDKSDVTAQELQRLLTIQPAYRKLLLDVIDYTPEKETLLSFADRLKEAHQTEGFLREAMDFAGIRNRPDLSASIVGLAGSLYGSGSLLAGSVSCLGATNERSTLAVLSASDPAKAVAKVLKKLQANTKLLEADKEMLKKHPESIFVTKYDLQSEDEVKGFDLRKLSRFVRPKESDDGKRSTQSHFALRLSIVATDNNVFTGPGVTTAALQYGFLIVSEDELLSLMMRDQRDYHTMLDKAVQELEKTRQGLENTLGDYRKSAEDPSKLLARAEAAAKAIRDGGITARAVFLKYEGLLREMEFNRMKEKRMEKVRAKVVKPLGDMTAGDGSFFKAETKAKKLRKELLPDADKRDKADVLQQADDPVLLKELAKNHQLHIDNADRTHEEMKALIRELKSILDSIIGVITEDNLLELATYLEETQRANDFRLRELQQRFREYLENILLGGQGGKEKR